MNSIIKFQHQFKNKNHFDRFELIFSYSNVNIKKNWRLQISFNFAVSKQTYKHRTVCENKLIQNFETERDNHAVMQEEDLSLNFNVYDLNSSLFYFVFSLALLLNSPLSTKYFNISNILYDSSIIQFYNDLIKFGNMENQIDLNIIFTNITFSNLIFEQGGNMLYFQQQLKNSISFQNIFFSNITGGSITIESANKQRLDLPTKVVFKNLTANLLNGVFYSFINVLTGGVLEIADSSFANIFNAQSGAVVYAGYKNSFTTIKNSVFVNNTSLKGGVFNIEYNSVIVLNNWSVTNSFAVESAVVQCSNNGYYQFYNSVFSNNYALSAAFGEIFDVSTTPLISNCTINNNFIKLQSTVTDEINKKCVDLWFLQKSFSQYLTNRYVDLIR